MESNYIPTITSNGNGHHSTLFGETTSTEAIVRQLLHAIGEDPTREGLQRTPERVARMYRELTAGYDVGPQKLINDALFDVDYSEMVVVKEIDFYSLCEHHLPSMVTSALLGSFKNNPQTRAEFMSHIYTGSVQRS